MDWTQASKTRQQLADESARAMRMASEIDTLNTFKGAPA
jgi:hypothetical protein